MNPAKIILIAGPTASGKSALALDMARRTNGVIINADAMQVYAGLPILTAQPEPDAQQEVPHELYGVLDPSERSSAGKWLALASAAIANGQKENRVPVLVGGTGLYFRTLLGGLADIPAIPETVRQETQALYARLGEADFRNELKKHDPASAARIERNDRQRLIRAYEVSAHTQKPLSEWQKATHAPVYDPEIHLVMPRREELYAACDRRLLGMIERGAVEEVRAFLKRRIDPELPAMKTLGLREIVAHLAGELSLGDAIAKAQQATRNYAKRQMTWFRNQKLGYSARASNP
ncbi:MAG: tRNA (adenosine(37)-N6)-dimethylallyltransferase MiaA [Bdellovibrionales bacterium]